MVNGTDFIYNNKRLSDFKMILCRFDISDDNIPLGLERTIEKGEINKYRYTPNFFGTKYTNTLSFKLTFMKSNKEYFTRQDLRNITSWLTSSQYPIELEIVDKNNIRGSTYFYMGLFTDIQTECVNGYIVGLTCSFTCDSPYAYKKKAYSLITTDEERYKHITIRNNSDESFSYVYPILTIHPTISTVITITNHTDNNNSFYLAVQNQNTLTMDCQKMIIQDKAGVVKLSSVGVSVQSNLYWLRLLHGDNDISLSSQAELTIEFKELVKVGGY